LAAVAARKYKWESINTQPLAISTDSVYSHKIFMEISPSGRKINYPLLSDRTHEVTKRYGVLNEKTGAAYRATFIIDPEGRIQSWLVNGQPVGRNIDEIIRLIQALQYNRITGLGVPADWNPGDPGISTDWENVGKY